MRVAVLQTPHEATFEANADVARAALADAAAADAALALLPEYWFLAQGDAGPAEAARAAAAREAEARRVLERASAEHGIAVAGNVLEARPDGLANVLLVCERGRVAWSQTKVHPMPGEAAWGVRGGRDLLVRDVAGARAGALVCADVLYPELPRLLALKGAEIVLNPVLSRWRADDPTRAAREAVFVARAWDGACFVLKASGFLPGRIAGRSLVAAPWGLLARYRDEAAPETLVADLDLDALRRFRKEHRGLQDRDVAAYRELVDDAPPG